MTDWREMARRDADFYDAVEHQEWLTLEACESVEATEAHWQRVFALMPGHVRDIRYMGDAG